MFYYFKIGIVYNRISYIDYKMVNIVHTQVYKSQLLLEWLRTIHLDKSIKTKVAQMLNKTSTGLNTSFVNMSKLQIDEYFTARIKEAKEKLTEDIVNLKLERSHYKYFIKQEINLMKSKMEVKYPLKIKFEDVKFLTQFNTCKKQNSSDDIFCAARDVLCLTPEKLSQKRKLATKSHSNEFIELIKSHNRQKSKDRIPEYNNSYIKTDFEDLEKSMLEKESIHRSFHNFKKSYSVTSQSPRRSVPGTPIHNHGIKAHQVSLFESKGAKSILPDPVFSQKYINAEINTFPKPLPSRILTPRNAPNDLFRRLESKLKASRQNSENSKSDSVNLSSIGGSIVEKVVDPELNIKEHIKILITSMRALRDVPNEYFKKSYFIKKQGQMDPKESLASLEDILREGRKISPDMSASKLFDNVHNSKIVSI